MRLKSQVLALAAAYCGPKGRSEATVSTLLFGSGKRLRELREGRDSASARLEDAVAWFANHWPADLAWPEDVPRPEVEAPPADQVQPDP